MDEHNDPAVVKDPVLAVEHIEMAKQQPRYTAVLFADSTCDPAYLAVDTHYL
jgi:hypothetical protein